MNAYEWMAKQPWLIESSALEAMVEIVQNHPDAITRIMARVSPIGDIETVATKDGDRLDGARKVQMRDGVAVVPVRGVISRYMNLFDDICGGTSVQTLATDIQKAADDPAVKAILLDIDSPGGSANGISELASQIRAATQVKPVCAYAGGMCCSAAYWLASACNEIVGNPMSIVGSVGVCITIDAKQKPGHVTIVSSQSPRKRPDVTTPDGKANVQEMCDAMAGEFIASIAEHRGTTPAKVLAGYGKGASMLGRAALKAKMIDSLGSFEACVKSLASGRRASDTVKTDDKRVPQFSMGASAHMNPFNVLAKLWATNPEEVKAALDESGEPIETAAPVAKTFPPPPAIPPLDVSALEKRVRAEMEAEFKTKSRDAAFKLLQANAKTWTTSLIEKKITPDEVDVICNAYVALAMADHDAPDKPKTLAVLTSAIESRGDHGLTSETIAEDATEAPDKLAGFKILQSAKTTSEKEREDANLLALLESTSTGRAGLALKK